MYVYGEPMSYKNTIIVVSGPSGREYVVKMGSTTIISTRLDDASTLSPQEAAEHINKMDRPAVAKDLDWYRVEVGRSREVAVRLERELQEILE